MEDSERQIFLTGCNADLCAAGLIYASYGPGSEIENSNNAHCLVDYSIIDNKWVSRNINQRNVLIGHPLGIYDKKPDGTPTHRSLTAATIDAIGLKEKVNDGYLGSLYNYEKPLKIDVTTQGGRTSKKDHLINVQMELLDKSIGTIWIHSENKQEAFAWAIKQTKSTIDVVAHSFANRGKARKLFYDGISKDELYSRVNSNMDIYPSIMKNFYVTKKLPSVKAFMQVRSNGDIQFGFPLKKRALAQLFVKKFCRQFLSDVKNINFDSNQIKIENRLYGELSMDRPPKVIAHGVGPEKAEKFLHSFLQNSKKRSDSFQDKSSVAKKVHKQQRGKLSLMK